MDPRAWRHSVNFNQTPNWTETLQGLSSQGDQEQYQQQSQQQPYTQNQWNTEYSQTGNGQWNQNQQQSVPNQSQQNYQVQHQNSPSPSYQTNTQNTNFPSSNDTQWNQQQTSQNPQYQQQQQQQQFTPNYNTGQTNLPNQYENDQWGNKQQNYLNQQNSFSDYQNQWSNPSAKQTSAFMRRPHAQTIYGANPRNSKSSTGPLNYQPPSQDNQRRTLPSNSSQQLQNQRMQQPQQPQNQRMQQLQQPQNQRIQQPQQPQNQRIQQPQQQQNQRMQQPQQQQNQRMQQPQQQQNQRMQQPQQLQNQRLQQPQQLQNQRLQQPQWQDQASTQTYQEEWSIQQQQFMQQQQQSTSQWDSSQQQSTSQWDNSQQQTTSQWDNSQQQTNSQWDNSQQQTNSQWDNSQQQTTPQWDNSQQSTSQWDNSQQQSTSQWDNSQSNVQWRNQNLSPQNVPINAPMHEQVSQKSDKKESLGILIGVHIYHNRKNPTDTKIRLDGTLLSTVKERLCGRVNVDPNNYEFRVSLNGNIIPDSTPLDQTMRAELFLVNHNAIPLQHQSDNSGTNMQTIRPSIFKVIMKKSSGKNESTGIIYEHNHTVRNVLEQFAERRGIDYLGFRVTTLENADIPLDTPISSLGFNEIYLTKLPKKEKVSPRELIRLDFAGLYPKQYPLKQPPFLSFVQFLIDSKLENISFDNFSPEVQSALCQKYWMGIKEIGFVFPLEEETALSQNLNLYQVVQSMLFNGINIAFEIGLMETKPQSVISSEELHVILATEVGITDLISSSFLTVLAQCREEVNDARSLFSRHLLQIEAESAYQLANPNEDPSLSAWRKYIKEEMGFVYINTEPPLPENTNVTLNVKLLDNNTTTLLCPVHAQIQAVILMIFERWNRVDSSSTQYDPRNFVLKATGLGEFLIPMNAELQQLSLGDFDYIRLQHRRDMSVRVSLFPRSFLHSTSQRDEAERQSTSQIITKLLARDCWTIPNEPSSVMSFTDVERSFKIKISGASVHSLTVDPKSLIFFSAGLYFGGRFVCPPVFTPSISVKNLLSNPHPDKWDEWIRFDIVTYNIPKETRICFAMYATLEGTEGINPTKVSDKDTPIGWVGLHILNDFLQLRTGEMTLKLWDGEVNPIGPITENTISSNPPAVEIEFESNSKIIVFPSPEIFDAIPNTTIPFPLTRVDPKDAQVYSAALGKDPLYHLTPNEIKTIWGYRDIICDTHPQHLSKVLQSCTWSCPDSVREMHRLIKKWKPIQTSHCALELLDAKYADEQVREFAVKNIEMFTDAEIDQYLLQLVQVLKYEPHHTSSLAFFLLRRALSNNNQTGHRLYWLMKSEMNNTTIYERYGVILEAYLRQSKGYRYEIKKQHQLLENLEKIAMKIKETPPDKRMGILKDGLAQIKFPDMVQLPIDPRFCVSGLVLDKCKYMDSKKLPLWLVFKNIEENGPPIFIIFKCGDDLRQDIFTLQLIRIMDNLWKNHGLDLMLEPYRVVATGDQVGMVEVVLDSETTGKIMKDAGGTLGVMRDDCITQFLKNANRTDAQFKTAQKLFTKSCAGYCVATYLLGIGDRHSDNVMVKRNGVLFHIDFGHFLGNFKKKFGLKRERAPFKFTPQFAHVMGGKGSPLYTEFQGLCCKSFMIVRKQRFSHLMIALFGLMLSTGIPELTHEDDIEYLRNTFSFEMEYHQAEQKFLKLINEALTDKTTTINDFFHAVAH